MHPGVSVGPGPILVIILAVGLLVAGSLFYYTRHNPQTLFMAAGRRPRHRHIVTRIVCGILGGTILITIAAVTMKEVQRYYQATDAGTRAQVMAPTKPAPALPKDKRKGSQTNSDPMRFLVNLIFAQEDHSGFVPRHVESFDVTRSTDANQGVQKGISQKGFQMDGAKIDFSFNITGSLLSNEGLDGDVWRPQGTITLQWQKQVSNSSISIGFQGPVTYLGGIETKRPESRPLSIVSGQPRLLSAFCIVTRVQTDDPLKAISQEEFIQSHIKEIQASCGVRGIYSPAARVRLSNLAVPALALVEHIGISSLLLLVAAILLSQLFKRRALAFAGVLAAMILYVAMLERLALGTHFSYLGDPKAEVAVRIFAAEQTTRTFFHRGASASKLEALAENKEEPQALRDAARLLAEQSRP